MDQTAKQSTVDRIGQATSILVTVSNNPSVDQLAACIGLTLFLNKQGKHATAVFSGTIPSTIEFLQPDKTIERTTDGLRDFIISLDKSKADKLRYKVEDKVVKIFITPYRTSIGEKDFEFSQGDFNVDAVIALGVHTREELDQAITAHGRILHDATVISINNAAASNLGTLNWQEPQASSLCEMLVELAEVMRPDGFDPQMATAFLTGIVAETKRFSNEKTSSRTMSLSAKLMAAGANQQLVASQLQSKSAAQPSNLGASDEDNEDGTLKIDHEPDTPPTPPSPVPAPQPVKRVLKTEPAPAPPSPAKPKPPTVAPTSRASIGDVRKYGDSPQSGDLMNPLPSQGQASKSPYSLEPPTRGGTLAANTVPEELSAPVGAFSSAADPGSLLKRDTQNELPSTNDLGDKTLATIEDAVDTDNTLTDIEKTLGSTHETATPQTSVPPSGLDTARSAVQEAASQSAFRPTPLVSLGSTPLDMNTQAPLGQVPPTPTPIVPPDPGLPPEQTGVDSLPTPPPVPPPMTPPFVS